MLESGNSANRFHISDYTKRTHSNLFGCSCNGGCRTAGAKIRRLSENSLVYVEVLFVSSKRSYNSLFRIVPDPIQNQGRQLKFLFLQFVDQGAVLFRSKLFAMTDSNSDGKITYAEWRDSAVRSTATNENDSTLLELWAKYDTDNVGYLTESEAINRKG